MAPDQDAFFHGRRHGQVLDFPDKLLDFLRLHHASARDGSHFFHQGGVDGLADFFPRFIHGDDGQDDGLVRLVG